MGSRLAQARFGSLGSACKVRAAEDRYDGVDPQWAMQHTASARWPAVNARSFAMENSRSPARWYTDRFPTGNRNTNVKPTEAR